MQFPLGDCTDHYCNQIGSGNYFQSAVNHQRGYGFFADVIRYITPIAKQGRAIFGKAFINNWDTCHIRP